MPKYLIIRKGPRYCGTTSALTRDPDMQKAARIPKDTSGFKKNSDLPVTGKRFRGLKSGRPEARLSSGSNRA